MRYSNTHSDQTSPRHSARMQKGMASDGRSVSARPGQCDAQMTLALEPGAERPAYVVQVKGDRMQSAGICSGDLVAIQKSGDGRRATVTLTRLDQSAREHVNRGARLPAVTLWGKPLTLSSSTVDIEGVFVGLLRQGRSCH
jgi:SOS-response transcriptional repressor LexA